MTTTHEARRLRQELATQDRGRGRRYDDEVRARVVAFAELRRAEGWSWMAIATELGVRFETLRRWCRGVPRVPAASVALRPVEVVADDLATPLVVVSRSGLRIEGATLDHVIALLRAVG